MKKIESSFKSKAYSY